MEGYKVRRRRSRWGSIKARERHLRSLEEALGLEHEDDLVNDGADGLLLNVDGEVGVGGSLIWVINTGEALDLTTAGTGVDTTLVGLLGVLERGGNVDEEERALAGDGGTGSITGVGVGSNGSSNDSGTGLGELRGNEGNTLDVLVTVLTGEAEFGGKFVTNSVSEEEGDWTTSLLVESDLKGTGNGGLTRVEVASEEDGEALLGTRGVGVTEDLNDLRVGEPLGNAGTGTETLAELSSGDVEGLGALWNLVVWAVLVRVREVGKHLELNDLDTELITVLLNEVLGVVWAVHFLASRVLSWTSMVTANDKVSASVVLTDDCVPEGLTGTTHSHGKGQETEGGHAVRVTGEESLIDTDTGEVVNVTRLGETNSWVDKDVGLTGTSSADGQLTVSSVHGVTGLESNNLGPAKLVEVSTELSRGDFITELADVAPKSG